MAKAKSIYSCSECGASSPKWQGQCPGCGEWNTLVEGVAEKSSGHRFESLAPTARLQTLSEIEAREVDRVATGIGEFDRALGGGLVSGGVVLIGGDPGIGKSLQAFIDQSLVRGMRVDDDDAAGGLGNDVILVQLRARGAKRKG